MLLLLLLLSPRGIQRVITCTNVPELNNNKDSTIAFIFMAFITLAIAIFTQDCDIHQRWEASGPILGGCRR